MLDTRATWLADDELATARERLPIVYIDAIPVRTDAQFKSDDPAVAEPLAAARKFGSYDPYFVNGVPCNYTEVRTAWAETRQAFWQDNADVQALLDAFVERANGIVTSCP
jgi:hypothetical protein